MAERTVDATIMFHEPNGTQYDAHVVAVAREGGDGPPLDVRVVFEVPWAIYERIDLLELFHLLPDLRGPVAGGEMEEDVDVRIEARLDRRLAEEHFAGGDAEAILQRLIELTERSPDDPLLETESWFGLYVTQAVEVPPDMPGELREGYQTVWASADVVENA